MNTTFNPLGCTGLRRVIIGVLCVLLTQAAVFGASFKLQGQSRGCGAWISGNLRNWRDLDYIPCRILVSGGAVQDRTVRITFPELNNGRPGFESLLDFTPSPNVTINSGPTFSEPVNGVRTCTLKVSYTGRGEGYIQFLARLAAGAHQNPGSSLMLGGDPSSMGKLQIHKPAPSASPTAFGKLHPIDRGAMIPGEGFQVELASLLNRRYCIQYSGDLENWKMAQCIVTGTGGRLHWVDRGPPETESHPAIQPMRFYRAFELPDNTQRCKHHGGRDKSCDERDDKPRRGGDD